MAKVRIGLDIGTTAVRAAELQGGDAPVVVRAAQVPLAEGAVEAGEIRQPDVVSEALRELWDRGGFKSRQVHMGVGNQRVVVREVALPWLPEKELRASLGFQAQEFIPMPVEEAVLDFDPLEEFEQEGRRMLRLILVAAQRAMVNTVVGVALDAKLEPVGVDLVPFAMARAVGMPEVGMEDEEGGEEAVVDIGATITNILVHERGVTRFVRILPSGGRDITLAIARSFGVEDDVAERLKRGEVIDGGPDPDEVRRVAMQRAQNFVDEVRSSLEFYTAQTRGARIGRVLVIGGGSKLSGFLELLREQVPAVVERGRVFRRAKSQLNLSEEALAEAEPVLAVAVGLGIPGEALRVSQVNLLPPELLARRKQKRLTSVIIGGGVAALLLLLGFWFLQGQKLADVNDQIAAQNATNAGLQAQIGELSEFQALQEEAAQKEALLAQAFAGEVSFSGLLMDVSRVIPSDAYLTALNLLLTEAPAGTEGAAAPAGGAAGGTLIGTVSADGQAAGIESLASWLTRLESVQGWVNPWLTSIQETESGSRLLTFSSGVDLSSDALTARGREGLSGGG